ATKSNTISNVTATESNIMSNVTITESDVTITTQPVTKDPFKS
ncbi:4418_t:CDS:1, partial [Racocetra persica]